MLFELDHRLMGLYHLGCSSNKPVLQETSFIPLARRTRLKSHSSELQPHIVVSRGNTRFQKKNPSQYETYEGDVLRERSR